MSSSRKMMCFTLVVEKTLFVLICAEELVVVPPTNSAKIRTSAITAVEILNKSLYMFCATVGTV
jgi:hypothetical protein